MPTVRNDVVSVATPLASVPVPSAIVPSKKVTTPLGIPAAEVTVVDKTTAVWSSAGLELLATEAADRAAATFKLAVWVPAV